MISKIIHFITKREIVEGKLYDVLWSISIPFSHYLVLYLKDYGLKIL